MPEIQDEHIKVIGNNYTQELKYPIKIYKIFENTKYEIQFSKGIELRKIATGVIAVVVMLTLMIIAIIVGSTGTLLFILNNWLIVLVGGVSVTIITVFSLNFDYKPIPQYFKDRVNFYKNRNTKFEHDINVDKTFDKIVKYEDFVRSDSNK